MTETPTLTADEDAPGPVIQRGSLALTLRRLRRDTAAMVALACRTSPSRNCPVTRGAGAPKCAARARASSTTVTDDPDPMS